MDTVTLLALGGAAAAALYLSAKKPAATDGGPSPSPSGPANPWPTTSSSPLGDYAAGQLAPLARQGGPANPCPDGYVIADAGVNDQGILQYACVPAPKA